MQAKSADTRHSMPENSLLDPAGDLSPAAYLQPAACHNYAAARAAPFIQLTDSTSPSGKGVAHAIMAPI